MKTYKLKVKIKHELDFGDWIYSSTHPLKVEAENIEEAIQNIKEYLKSDKITFKIKSIKELCKNN